MSWDVMIFGGDPEQFTNEETAPSLGDAADVRTKISRSLPEVDWTDPAWGVLEGDGWSIEFNHKTDGIADELMLHVRGGGDPIGAIVKLCRDNGWVAYDTTADAVIDLAAPWTRSWEEFQAFRDKAFSVANPSKGGPASIQPRRVMFILLGLVVLVIVYSLWKRYGSR